MRILGLVLVTWMLSACAGGPANQSLDAEAKLFLPPADKACIYVVPSFRTSGFTVSMDGRKVGTLGNENYFRLDVAPGPHVLSVTHASLVPFVREPRDDVTVDAEVGHCYYLRTAWKEAEGDWRQFRVYWERLSDQEGRRAVNVLWLTQP